MHGQESCKLFGFIFYTNIYVGIAFLCCISVDRYLAVAHPLRFAKVRRVKTAMGVSAVVWVIEVVANSAPLFHDELFENGHNLTLCFERYPMQVCNLFCFHLLPVQQLWLLCIMVNTYEKYSHYNGFTNPIK